MTLKKSGKQYFLRDWHISQYLQYFWETFLSTIFAIFLRDISEHNICNISARLAHSPRFNWADTSPWICWNGCPFNLISTWVFIKNPFMYKIHCSGVYSFGMHPTRFNPGLFYKLLYNICRHLNSSIHTEWSENLEILIGGVFLKHIWFCLQFINIQIFNVKAFFRKMQVLWSRARSLLANKLVCEFKG